MPKAMIEANGTHPKKPTGVLCKRSALMKWTGWSETDVDYYVGVKRLRTTKIRKGGRLRYYVESAEKILGTAR